MAGGRAKELYRKEAKERMKAGGGDKKSKKAKSGVAPEPHPIRSKKKGDSRDRADAAVFP